MEIKEIEEQYRKAIDMLICQYCWDEGCKALFGNDTMNIEMVDSQIRMIGAKQIIQQATWSFTCPTEDGYEEWLKRKVKIEELPKYISFDGFAEMFKHQLTEMYQKEKKENERKTNG